MASHFDAEHSSKKRLNIAAVGWVVLFAGALLLLVPDFVELSYGLRANSEMAAASKAIDAASDSNAVSESAAGEEALETADRGVSSRPWLESYNERVRQGGGMVINDPFTFGAADQSFAKTGLAGLPVGVLTVDSMACEAPVYLGSSEQNMLNGAAVVAGTSAPLGGPRPIASSPPTVTCSLSRSRTCESEIAWTCGPFGAVMFTALSRFGSFRLPISNRLPSRRTKICSRWLPAIRTARTASELLQCVSEMRVPRRWLRMRLRVCRERRSTGRWADRLSRIFSQRLRGAVPSMSCLSKTADDYWAGFCWCFYSSASLL